MQRARFLLASSGLIVAGAAIWASGCSTFREDCENGVCAPYKPSESSSSSGGDGGHIEAACTGDPSETDPRTMDLKAVDPDCSVFAWAGATGPTPDGTMANPFPTLQAAIDDVSKDGKDKGKWIIACNKDDFTENASTPNSAQIYGGYDCSTLAKWAIDPSMKRTNLVGKDAGAAALTLTNGGTGVSVRIKDFTITSPNATVNGSSVAVAVDDITATLINCDVKAGDGGDGEDGLVPSGIVVAGASAPMPNAATMNACINPAALSSGPAAMPTACDDGMSIAGDGGKGGDTGDGQPGADGQPADMTQGKGGSADTGAGCTDGAKGKDGDPGSDGEPGPAQDSPEAATLTGITGGNGGIGKPGGRGQGGGGGGGRKSGNFCPPAGNVLGNGASGGGGGAGGCGGKGGGGGKAGGSSIGIIYLGTKLTLTDVTLTAGKGGKGGNGSAPQGGGTGGTGSFGGASSGFGTSKAGCKGGGGGDGGAGGVGGGGRGGHSFGIVYTTTPNAAPVLKSYTPGAAGLGGDAGPGGPMSSNGAAGLSRQCWDFSKKASCM